MRSWKDGIWVEMANCIGSTVVVSLGRFRIKQKLLETIHTIFAGGAVILSVREKKANESLRLYSSLQSTSSPTIARVFAIGHS